MARRACALLRGRTKQPAGAPYRQTTTGKRTVDVKPLLTGVYGLGARGDPRRPIILERTNRRQKAGVKS